MQIKNFQIIRSLERNTLSELFLARHVHENYTVKIRLYDQYNIANEEVREAILQRLRNSYQMRHRNIIATLDYGVEGRYMYQVQEHMDHGTLEELLQKTKTLPPEIAAFILQEVLRGLQYAHSIGIFHGMLNPAKILLSANGIVKIDDFQFLDLKNTFLKQVQTRIKVKQQMYLAPEHLLGKEADYRCDLFSVGVITYKMLTGRHPFLEEEAEWTTMQIIACNAKLLFELDPTLPPQIETVVEKMIEKEPGKRLQSAEEALRVLDSYVDSFGEIRSYDVLANFLKKPAASVDQLNLLRAEEFMQQAAQYQMQEQLDRALIAFYRAQFLKPKDKTIEAEIKTLSTRAGYTAADSSDTRLVQLEQSLRTNPDNIQVLQRLATLAKSRGDLLKCIAYYKRILHVHPGDTFALSQISLLLHGKEREGIQPVTEGKWVRWQDFYRNRERPFWDKWPILHGNIALLAAVVCFALLIGGLQIFNLIPRDVLSATPAAIVSHSSDLVVNQKVDSLCQQAETLRKQGNIEHAIELLSKAPLPEKGPAGARAHLQLANYLLEIDQADKSVEVLESLDIASADFRQKIACFKMKAEGYRRLAKYGHAMDQYISIAAMPGVPAPERKEAEAKIQELQNEALQNP
jgi:serine/threonine protein kinase